jgi:hypothetical protein
LHAVVVFAVVACNKNVFPVLLETFFTTTRFVRAGEPARIEKYVRVAVLQLFGARALDSYSE